MQICKAIELADNLCPNPYTLEEKLRWCDEVTAGIRRDVKKIYRTIETSYGGGDELELPDDIPFEDLELAFWNGQPMDKLDFRSFWTALGGTMPPGKLRLVYLEQPQPIRQISIQGTFDLSENSIQMEVPPFQVGDTLEWVPLTDADAEPDWSQAKQCCVLDQLYDRLIVEDGAFTPQTAARLAIRRVPDDCTEIDEAPYDGMYVEYLLAKMALYQHDYTAYGAHMAQYNTLYDSLRRDYKSRSPLTTMSALRRYW